jgi:D-threo-aldose 1-dehydrogenase
MKTRKLGNTKLSLTEISFGATGIGNLYRPVTPQDAFDTLDTAWSAGIRYYDTAPLYGHGLSERRLGDFLRQKERSDFVLSSKVGRILKPVRTGNVPDFGYVDPLPFEIEYDYSYHGIMRSYEDSIARLGLPSIDLLYVHDLEQASFGDEETYRYHFETFANDGVNALRELKSSGLISAYGLGVNDVTACINALRHTHLDCILLAGRYSLLDRSAQDQLLPLCEQRGTALVIGGVFNSGILATGARPGATFDYKEASRDVLDRVAMMETEAAEHGVPLAAAALHFPLRSSNVASVLIGTAKPSSLVRNLDLVDLTVPDALWPKMDALAFHHGVD